jgi:hypothetical protein
LPAQLQEGLEKEFHLSSDDFEKLAAGQAIARIVPTGQPDDVRMIGVVLIKITSDDFIKAFRDIENFEKTKEVIRTHRFSSPPAESDLVDFAPDIKKSEILACHPGHCSYKLPAEAMQALQTSINWDAPDANEKSNLLVRKMTIDYLNRYRMQGDRALAVYYDTPAPYSLAEGLHSLIGSETRIGKALPDLIHYASTYPAGRPADTEDFFYWQEAAFGLKHVLRTQHVIIQRLPSEFGSRYAIISKMLFASHYFRAAVEFKYVYPVQTPSGEPAIYLITAQRSFIDGLTGLRGAIVRKVAEGRSPASLAADLQLAKEKMERH